MDSNGPYIPTEIIEAHRAARQVEKIEQPKSTKTFEQLQKAIKSNLSEATYREELIRATIRKKEGLRKCYLVAILNNPARLNDFKDNLVATRKTIYGYLYGLISLSLMKKISVMDIVAKKSKLEEQETVILSKFNDWTSKMSVGMKQRFAATTNYFVLTELGKKSSIIEWALRQEKELKNIGEENANE